jgi:hypothetical protein
MQRHIVEDTLVFLEGRYRDNTHTEYKRSTHITGKKNLFPGAKAAGPAVDHSPPHLAPRLKEWYTNALISHSRFHGML